MKRAISLEKENVLQIREKVEHYLGSKGHCIVLFIGSPGSGKSTLARYFREHGFFSIPKERLIIIDDLKGPEKKKYNKKELLQVADTLDNRVLLVFDYRAAQYVRNADIGIVLIVSEEERIRNLQKRSSWSLKKYRRSLYRFPPIPFTYNDKSIYILSINSFEIFWRND